VGTRIKPSKMYLRNVVGVLSFQLPGEAGAAELRACLVLAAAEGREPGVEKALHAWGEGTQPPLQLEFK
jgi:hypothetical protein